MIRLKLAKIYLRKVAKIYRRLYGGGGGGGGGSGGGVGGGGVGLSLCLHLTNVCRQF